MRLSVLQTVNNWAKKVTEAGGTATVYEYEKEGHGFMNAGKDIHEMMKSEPLPFPTRALNAAGSFMMHLADSADMLHSGCLAVACSQPTSDLQSTLRHFQAASLNLPTRGDKSPLPQCKKYPPANGHQFKQVKEHRHVGFLNSWRSVPAV